MDGWMMDGWMDKPPVFYVPAHLAHDLEDRWKLIIIIALKGAI